ncbi:MAG: hypothetical protein DRP45_06595 [Candidatus Zixiibacteriota bacterium]|nr:MAG: hypothetical protein DRP45_06595 [candidate division Zixibacteria bacterium]
MRKHFLAYLVVICCCPAVSGSFDLITSRGLGLGHSVVLSGSSASVLVNVPTGGLASGAWHFECGYDRRFGLSDLDNVFVSGAKRWRWLTVGVGASQFGKTDLYAEQLLKGSLAFHLDSLTFGGTLSAMQVQIGNGYGTLRAATVGAGASWRSRRFFAAATFDNLTSPSLAEYSPTVKPIYSAYAELIGLGSYSITSRATFEDLQKPSFAGGLIVQVSNRASIFGGVSTEPMEYGGGVEMYIRSGVITYATSVHPVLGLSHTVSFGLGSVSRGRTQKGAFD